MRRYARLALSDQAAPEITCWSHVRFVQANPYFHFTGSLMLLAVVLSRPDSDLRFMGRVVFVP
jgi:hypothetical protein